MTVPLREHERTSDGRERTLRLILVSSPNIIVVTDQSGRVVTADRALARIGTAGVATVPAVEQRDLETFLETAHALRSSSANVGAQHPHRLSSELSDTTPPRLEQMRRTSMDPADRAFERYRRPTAPTGRGLSYI